MYKICFEGLWGFEWCVDVAWRDIKLRKCWRGGSYAVHYVTMDLLSYRSQHKVKQHDRFCGYWTFPWDYQFLRISLPLGGVFYFYITTNITFLWNKFIFRYIIVINNTNADTKYQIRFLTPINYGLFLCCFWWEAWLGPCWKVWECKVRRSFGSNLKWQAQESNQLILGTKRKICAKNAYTSVMTLQYFPNLNVKFLLKFVRIG